MQTQLTAAALLDHMGDQGLVADKQPLAAHILASRPDRELPLYVRALAGIGATIGAVCFLLFLYEAGLVDVDTEFDMIIWGVLAMLGAVGLHRMGKDESRTARHSFFVQGSFTFMALGKGLFVAGLAILADSSWGATAGLLIVTLGTWFVYDMSIDRFLSALGVLVSLTFNILSELDSPLLRNILLDGLFMAELAGAAYLFTSGRVRHALMPLAYSLAAALAGNVLILSSKLAYGPWRAEELLNPALINASLGIALVLLAAYAAGGLDKLRREILSATAVTAALLALVSAPGIMLALILMILGYARHDTIMLRSGGFLLPLVLLQYYANMDVTLLVKSGVLVASGVVLLGARAWLSGRNLVKGAAS